jgi:hypothetical protein
VDRSRLGGPGARRWLIAGLLALALVGLGIAFVSAQRLYRRQGRPPPPPPRQTDVSLIAPWMTIPHVARIFRVRPEEIASALGVPLESSRSLSLSDLARQTGRTTDEVLEIVRTTVQTVQASQPPAKPDRPPDKGAPERGPPPGATPGKVP